MVFTIHGETPSKKNSRINTKSGRSFPNQRYMKWHDSAIAEIHFLMGKGDIERIPMGTRIELTLTFFHGDLKRRDSDNQTSSILDTLTDSGILEDDNWKVIPIKHIYDSYDKGNARCEVSIEAIE